MQNWIFSIHYSIFSVTWFFRNHSNMLIFCSRDILIIINVENNCALLKLWCSFSGFLDEKKNLNQKKIIWIHCNVYTVNDQFNASLLNKRIHFSKKKNLTDTKIFNSTWICNVCQPNCNIFAITFPVSLISDTCTSMMLCSSSTYSLSVSINSFIMWLLRKGKRKKLSVFCQTKVRTLVWWQTLWRVCSVHHVINCWIQISLWLVQSQIGLIILSQIFSVFNHIMLILGFRHLNTHKY